jgi:multiple antibiotic resistance protein
VPAHTNIPHETARGRAIVGAGLHGGVAVLAVLSLCASAAAQAPALPAAPRDFEASQAFTFLFLAMGPVAIIPAFASLTAGRDRAFKQGLALQAIGIVVLAVVVAATSGVGALRAWEVSTAALTLTIGLLLLLVALRNVLEVHEPAKKERPPDPDAPLPTRNELAFTPLAFPIVISPFGIGIVVLLLMLAQERGATGTLAVLIAIVLALDLLAMLVADWVMRAPFIKYALLITGSVMGVLQVALAVDAMADAIRALNLV